MDVGGPSRRWQNVVVVGLKLLDFCRCQRSGGLRLKRNDILVSIHDDCQEVTSGR